MRGDGEAGFAPVDSPIGAVSYSRVPNGAPTAEIGAVFAAGSPVRRASRFGRAPATVGAGR